MSQVRFPQQYVSKSYLVGVSTGLSGSASTAQVNGATLSSALVGDTLAARVSAVAFTNGLVINVKWQVLDNDNATWIDCVESWNPANVALATGTGVSAGVTGTKIFTAPAAIRAGNRSARCVAYTSGSGPAQGLGFDYANVAYDFRSPVGVYGG